MSGTADRLGKYLASFFRRDWQLNDYPLITNCQSNLEDGDGIPRWVAQISGWAIFGSGETRDAALANLQEHFDAYKLEHPLPRPGTRVPLSFGSVSELDRHGELAYEFVERTVGVRPFFISDGSSLSDFEGVTPMESIHRTILETYGIDSAPFESEPLWKLLDAIRSAQSAG